MTATTNANERLRARRRLKGRRAWYRRPWVFAVTGVLVILASLAGWRIATSPKAPQDPPEADKVLAAQADTKNFGILIPAYLPKGFDRESVEVTVNQNGPAGEPAVDLVYRSPKGAVLFMHQWVPVNPDLEVLNGSRIIETKWGKSWLLTEGTDGLVALWVDVGPLRISLYSPSQRYLSRQQLVLAANTLGLASNLQVYSFISQLPVIKDVEPPPPFEVQTNADGVQEFNLTITPGGFTPMRFSVKKGIPVKLHFRALGQVGCGNTLIIPIDQQNMAALTLESSEDIKVLEFTPEVAGDINFHCTTNCYRGIMTVIDQQ
jgi:hypothetical protein